MKKLCAFICLVAVLAWGSDDFTWTKVTGAIHAETNAVPLEITGVGYAVTNAAATNVFTITHAIPFSVPGASQTIVKTNADFAVGNAFRVQTNTWSTGPTVEWVTNTIFAATNTLDTSWQWYDRIGTASVLPSDLPIGRSNVVTYTWSVTGNVYFVRSANLVPQSRP